MTEVENTAPEYGDVAVESTPAAAPAKEKKLTSAGLIQRIIEALPAGVGVTLEQLVTAHEQAGIPTEAKKIYNNAQSLASNGKIGRGAAKQTWVKLSENVDPSTRREANKTATAESKPRASRKGSAAPAPQFTNEQVFAHLEDQIGPRSDRQDDDLGHTAVLLGATDPAQLILNATLSLGGDPDGWYTTTVGENTAVGLVRRNR